MREVKLWGLSGATLIVPEQSGVTYSNQVGGTACFQMAIEGVLIPLNNDCLPEHHEELLETYLCRYFSDLDRVFGADDVPEFNKLLWNFPETTAIRVDESKIEESCEAWIYVIVNENSFSDFSGFGEFKGVLTWCNSD
jgi:hypothetical protein